MKDRDLPGRWPDAFRDYRRIPSRVQQIVKVLSQRALSLLKSNGLFDSFWTSRHPCHYFFPLPAPIDTIVSNSSRVSGITDSCDWRIKGRLLNFG
jgi:hypothetical protein